MPLLNVFSLSLLASQCLLCCHTSQCCLAIILLFFCLVVKVKDSHLLDSLSKGVDSVTTKVLFRECVRLHVYVYLFVCVSVPHAFIYLLDQCP